MKMPKKITQSLVISIVAVLVILVSLSLDGYFYWTMRKQNLSLLADLERHDTAISIIQRKLSSTTFEKLSVLDSLKKEKENTYLFQNQIQNLAGTVGVLEKLSKTDTELLKKYSKVYFLNENYIPPKLVPIEEQYLHDKSKPLEIHEKVYPHLKNMLEKAKSEGVTIQVISAYRSFGTQALLKSGYKVTYGAGTANRFSADQGYSEHQLGTTLDFTTPSVGATFSGFEKTDAYKWLMENSYKYGFTLSYPKGNVHYIFEPWHFRFVSIALATSLYNDKINFYDLDQRVVDQYLLNFFD